MPFDFFREDNRSPAEIQAAGGFRARVQMDTGTARDLIARSVRDPNTVVALPPAERTVSDYLDNQMRGKLVGLQQLYEGIRKETNTTTLHVSTARTEDCGGKNDKNYTYRIESPLHELYVWEQQVGDRMRPTSRRVTGFDDVHRMSGAPSSKISAAELTPTRAVLLTDTPRLEDANVIAISSPKGEVAFLTGVPGDWVTQSRARGAPVWNPMPGPAPIAVALPPTAAPAAAMPAVASSSSSSPAYDHAYQDPSHPKHALYQQASAALVRDDGRGQTPGDALTTPLARANAAASLTDAALSAAQPLSRIDHVSANGNRLFAIQGGMQDASRLLAPVDIDAQGRSNQPVASMATPATPASAGTPTQTQAPIPSRTP